MQSDEYKGPIIGPLNEKFKTHVIVGSSTSGKVSGTAAIFERLALGDDTSVIVVDLNWAAPLSRRFLS